MKQLIGDIAVELGVLKPMQVNRLVEIQKSSSSTHLFGDLAVVFGYLNPSQLEVCLRLQEYRNAQTSFTNLKSPKSGFFS